MSAYIFKDFSSSLLVFSYTPSLHSPNLPDKKLLIFYSDLLLMTLQALNHVLSWYITKTVFLVNPAWVVFCVHMTSFSSSFVFFFSLLTVV